MKSTEELQKEKIEVEVAKLKFEVAELEVKLSAKTLDKLTLEKLQSEIAKNQSDAERNKEEVKNISHRNHVDNKRFWIGVFAPTITAVALVGTLMFQILNNREEKQLKRQADLDTQWRTFLSKVSDSSINIQNAILNRSFFSTQYKNEALEIAANVYLSYAPNIKFFEFLYNDFSRAIDTTNYRNLVDLTYNLYQVPDTSRKMKKLSLTERRNCLQKAGHRLLRFVKVSGKKIPLNLQDACFYNLDISDIEFGKADLNNVVVDSSSVLFADFSNVVSGVNSSWKGTAWWRAIKISDALLYYLVQHFPYNPNNKYFDNQIGKADEATPAKDRNSYAAFLKQYNDYAELKKRVDKL